ncbi:DUF2232 domain-containing protein [Erysipelothrix sp. HDW6C]|uniref:DUF2232 domain-containing protein n=1 Tax=Erysipelothrix sp. HDW6C TaxID=2714930 RepID=UPI00140D58AB|nr:DUF2232 domain-containing protein [Erysipelothrix sp. HDW6C]QIK68927.1 DUF2232 domain-containing protein [Erysipelothrix sp. HDW6C]
MRNTKHITAGAMTIALTGIIIFMERITAGFFMSFLSLPLIVYGYFYSLKSSIPVYFSCIFMAFIITGFPPTIIQMTGYGLVGLVSIFATEKRMTRQRTFVLMSLAIIPVYAVMVGFFGAAFGFAIPEMIQSLNNLFPFINNPMIITVFAYVSLGVTALMEVFIIKVSGDLVIGLLHKHFKK